jgi:hypothetical protein
MATKTPAVKKATSAKRLVVPPAKKAVTKRVPKGGIELTSANHEMEELKAENAQMRDLLELAAKAAIETVKRIAALKMKADYYEAISHDFDDQITDLKKKLKKAKAA